MADFDPDAYLKQKESGASGFDPDAYLAKKKQAQDASISTARASDLGFAQGGTFGFADELGGLVGKLLVPGSDVKIPESSPDDTPAEAALRSKFVADQQQQPTSYELVRDKMRGEAEQAKAEHPDAFKRSEFGGAVAASLLPIGPAGGAARGVAGFGRAALAGAGMGAAYGAGESDADILRKGEFGKLTEDTALGGTLGAAGGVIGHGVGEYAIPLVVKGASKLAGVLSQPVRDFVERRIGKAVGDEALKQAAKVEAAARSAQGSYRSAVQSASRDLEVLQREAEAMPDGQVKDEIRQFLASPEASALREQVAGNKLETAPERIDEMRAKLDEFKALAANKPAAVADAVEEGLANPAQRHILPRVATLGHRMLPIALPAAGYAVGGPEGGAIGTAAAGILALAQGRPGIIIRNMVREPAVRKAFWDKVLSTLPGSPAYTQVIPVLERAATEGEQKFATTAFVLSQQNPAARELLKRVTEFASSGDAQQEPMARR